MLQGRRDDAATEHWAAIAKRSETDVSTQTEDCENEGSATKLSLCPSMMETMPLLLKMRVSRLVVSDSCQAWLSVAATYF